MVDEKVLKEEDLNSVAAGAMENYRGPEYAIEGFDGICCGQNVHYDASARDNPYFGYTGYDRYHCEVCNKYYKRYYKNYWVLDPVRN